MITTPQKKRSTPLILLALLMMPTTVYGESLGNALARALCANRAGSIFITKTAMQRLRQPADLTGSFDYSQSGFSTKAKFTKKKQLSYCLLERFVKGNLISSRCFLVGRENERLFKYQAPKGLCHGFPPQTP
ncbi:hypothetical protein ACQZV8_00890 [Magnetococcales bacterium HHB-1]